MENKICSMCGESKTRSDYYSIRNGKYLLSWCKKCNSKRCYEWQKNNPEKVKKQIVKFKIKNPDYVKKYSKSRYRHWDTLNEKDRNHQLFKRRFGEIFNRTVKGNVSSKYIKYLGCSTQELRSYLEKDFKINMSWNNRKVSDGWQIDHILPMKSFDLSKEEDRIRCLHYSNLQCLWDYDNRVKGSKVLA